MELLGPIVNFLIWIGLFYFSLYKQRKRYEKIIEGMRVDFNKKLFDADLKMRIEYGQELEEGND